MAECRTVGLFLLACYAAAATFMCLHRPRLNSICQRDFLDPASDGSCLCNRAKYCLCTPNLASDVIIELEDGGVVFIERKDGRGLAMVGGFVRVGEDASDAAVREAMEETGLAVTGLRQFCLFSAPHRDPRRHTAALVHVARARGTPRASDDAKGVRVVPIETLQRDPPKFAFDHAQIVAAYVHRFHPEPAGGGRTPAPPDHIAEACPVWSGDSVWTFHAHPQGVA